jgi:hypothetical protein
MLWESFPGETPTDSFGIIGQALVGWLVTSVLIFLMVWFFFNLFLALGRWIWERFYRTPTL